jgi:hypothetical protein
VDQGEGSRPFPSQPALPGDTRFLMAKRMAVSKRAGSGEKISQHNSQKKNKNKRSASYGGCLLHCH